MFFQFTSSIVIATEGRPGFKLVAANADPAMGMNWRRVNFDDNRNLDPDIDIEKPPDAIAWLRARGLVDAGESPQIETLPGGVSSRTVLVKREHGRSMVLKQSLAKLRVAVDWFSSPQRVHREALAMRWFAKLAPSGTITELLDEDMETHIIAMEAVPKPHSNWKTMLLGGDVRTEHIRQFAEILAAVHHSSPELQELFQDKTFFETLRIEPYYRYPSRLAPELLGSLIEETLATNASLVHGDFSPKNVLVHQGRMVLLDHEVAHYGDPAFDIGFAMAHFLSKAHHLPEQREQFMAGAVEFWTHYRKSELYASFESRCVRHSLACLLARVRGRSPLEYLNQDERDRQADAVLHIMRNPPSEIPTMIQTFEKELACR
jgi:aminoglycoside phosphotransferase (APT) family kinase protein